MSYDPIDVSSLDSNKELCDLLRFLINDQAFSEDFIITTIFEYYRKNKSGLNKGAI